MTKSLRQQDNFPELDFLGSDFDELNEIIAKELNQVGITDLYKIKSSIHNTTGIIQGRLLCFTFDRVTPFYNIRILMMEKEHQAIERFIFQESNYFYRLLGNQLQIRTYYEKLKQYFYGDFLTFSELVELVAFLRKRENLIKLILL